MEEPSDWTTESESLATETETDSSVTTEVDYLPDGESDNSDGPSAGVIAGAVVGSIAGLALIVCSLILAFRMGRRSRNDAEDPHRSFRDLFKSLPRPTIAWTRPEPKPSASVIQPTFVRDEGLGLADTNRPSLATTIPSEMESRSPAPPPAYIRKEEETMESPASPSTNQAGNPVPSPELRLPATNGGLAVELPTGLDSQGWAVTRAQQDPYEMDTRRGPEPSSG
ncbi:hypothetical protein FNYG_02964 [Fusarium nygamai]|uniref:Uncharacterized protein n=1 Tax=Gibberella nygamai TaxID=42673 RepID=A0A2K0WN39_GIBNY|nr:hypothetical protein FNYG_02964 [Fusarium nygamai]